jgi:hypothetical protein
MKARIKAPFASARRTADVLGVSESRFKQLERLAYSDGTIQRKAATIERSVGTDMGSPIRVHVKFAQTGSKSSKSNGKVGSGKRKVGKKTRTSVKRHSRAKTAS